MANQQNAPANQPPEASPDTSSEHYFQSFYAALASSARGHAFLAEYARRNRHADTQVLLAALDRLETLVRADGAALTQLRDQLHMLLIAIRVARPEIDNDSPPAKAAKLAKLLDLLERRIDAMAEGKAAEPLDAINTSPEAPPPPLSVVPLSDEPELPIPSGAPQPAIALVQEGRLPPAPAKPEPVKALPGPDPVWRPIFDNSDAPTAAIMPEVDFTGEAIPAPASMPPPAPPATETPAVLPEPRMLLTLPAGFEPQLPAAIARADDPLPVSRADALAAIMALSEEQRIALFT